MTCGKCLRYKCCLQNKNEFAKFYGSEFVANNVELFCDKFIDEIKIRYVISEDRTKLVPHIQRGRALKEGEK